MVHFGEFLKTWSLRSNSVTRQVSFNRAKIGGKCQNSKIQMRHFEWFSNTVQASERYANSNDFLEMHLQHFWKWATKDYFFDYFGAIVYMNFQSLINWQNVSFPLSQILYGTNPRFLQFAIPNGTVSQQV